MSTRNHPSLLLRTTMSRRNVFGAAVSILATDKVLAADQVVSVPQVLQEGDRVLLETDPETIIEKAYQLGYEYEKKHDSSCCVSAEWVSSLA